MTAALYSGSAALSDVTGVAEARVEVVLANRW